MSKIIAVISGKSGTGKSTACANIATALAHYKKRTVIVELGQTLRCQDLILGSTALTHDIMQYIANDNLELTSVVQQVRESDENLYLVCASLEPYATANEPHISAILGVVEELRDSFDYIVIDTANSGSLSSLGSALAVGEIADEIIMVTTPERDSVRDCAALSDLLYIKKCENQRLLINKVDTEILTELPNLDAVMDEVGIPLIGVLLEDNDVKICTAKGITLPARSRPYKEYHAIAKRLLGDDVALTL
ncbi:MAG: AAA family ATPase [Oscillospiraceae bacterium]|nr:AAA family ATPase [Oscillospiraceae bacterium]